MKKLVEEIVINRDISFVFNNIYKSDVYEKWAASFGEGSQFIGELIEGSEVSFTDGKTYTLPATIDSVISNRLISFKIGEDFESYHFEDVDGSTLLVVKLNGKEEEYDQLKSMWDRAILNIKKVLEEI